MPMASNLKVRTYQNASIYRQHRKRALGFDFCLAHNWKDELYVVPFPTDATGAGVSMMGGNGHIRLNVKNCFKENFGTETPTFEQVYAFYSAYAVETIKDGVRKDCCSA